MTSVSIKWHCKHCKLFTSITISYSYRSSLKQYLYRNTIFLIFTAVYKPWHIQRGLSVHLVLFVHIQRGLSVHLVLFVHIQHGLSVHLVLFVHIQHGLSVHLVLFVPPSHCRFALLRPPVQTGVRRSPQASRLSQCQPTQRDTRCSSRSSPPILESGAPFPSGLLDLGSTGCLCCRCRCRCGRVQYFDPGGEKWCGQRRSHTSRESPDVVSLVLHLLHQCGSPRPIHSPENASRSAETKTMT